MKADKCKVTVIMGLYNCETTIEEAIQSIINQTFIDWNMIICDDGSSDRSYNIALEIAKKHSDKIFVIKNEENKGLNYTLNRCIDMVKSEYIARMDADDICDPTRLEKEVSVLNGHPEYAFVSCPMVLFDERGEWGCDWGMEKPVSSDLIRSRPFCHAACMIRTDVLKAVGGYTVDPRIIRVEDLHLWMKLYEKGYIGYNIQEPLYKMRDDRNAYRRRKYKYRINEAYVGLMTVRRLNLSPFYILYALRPLVVGLVPERLYTILHKNRLGKNNY